MRPASARPNVVRLVRAGLIVAELVMTAIVVKHWAYVSTHRLYLDRRVDVRPESTAAQRFELDRDHVVPQIVMQDDRVTFRPHIGGTSTILATLKPDGRAVYEIALKDSRGARRLASGEATSPIDVSIPLAVDDGEIEFNVHGKATWLDPRLRRNFQGVRSSIALLALFFCSVLLARRDDRPLLAGRPRRFVVRATATAVSVAFGLVLLETTLRAVGPLWSRGLSAARHDLGELTPDQRWQETSRYGVRLRPNVDAVNQWRDGDIVRMGFIPPASGARELHRFRFRTDPEGFRNDSVRDPVDIAVLGDSFTDAMTVTRDAAWPSILQRQLDVIVQNYGTAGFGPQQELLVLTDYVLRHHPRTVVLAYFAGNDMFDAEAFDRFVRSHGTLTRPAPGWPIKEVVTRADTWYVTSAMQAIRAAFTESGQIAAVTATPVERESMTTTMTVTRFERGRFTAAVNGNTLQWALMPPYLNLLRFSESYLEHRQGWALTRTAIGQMRDAVRQSGAQFVVMFLPFKSQVYLPALERLYSRDQLDAAFRAYLPGTPLPPSLETMNQNRLAQNAMMRRLCAEIGVPLVDVTDALQERFEQGENVYFPDDSHINEIGHAVVAQALSAYLSLK